MAEEKKTPNIEMPAAIFTGKTKRPANMRFTEPTIIESSPTRIKPESRLQTSKTGIGKLADVLYESSGKAEAHRDKDVATASATYDISAKPTSSITASLSAGGRKSLRGPLPSIISNLRVTTRMDYAQDVCKDWMETGFCVFGDSCKFMHVRDESRAGFQLDAEWEALSKKRAKKDDKIENRVALEDATPVCGVCKKRDVERPRRTKECGHIFCEACILAAFRKKPRCPTCSTPISGQLLVK